MNRSPPFFKRVIPLFLAVLLFPALLAVPARADEVTESGWIDILDYGFPKAMYDFGTRQELNTNSFRLRSDGEEKLYLHLYYNIPGDVYLYDYDIIFRTDAQGMKIGAPTKYLTIVALGDGFYRAFGDVDSMENPFFYLSYYTGTYFEVLSFKASTISSIYRTLSANLTVQAYNGTFSDADYTGSGYVAAEWDMSGVGYDSREFSSYLVVTGNVHAYDFVDVSLVLNVEDIESIAVDDSLNPLPYEINSIYQATANVPEQPNTVVTLRIDIRGLEDGYNPIIRITGYSHTAMNRYTISYVGGVLVIDSPNPLMYWFTKLNAWFDIQTSSIVDSISTWGQNIVNALGGNADTSEMESEVENIKGELESANDAMQDFTRPDVDTVIVDVDLDTGQGTPFSDMMGAFFENEFIVSIITGALAFTLFGVIVG